MFRAFVTFELRRRLKMFSSYVYALILFASIGVMALLLVIFS